MGGKVRTRELFVKFGDVVCSSGESNRNPQFVVMLGASSSMLVGTSSSVPVIAPEAVLVVSPSFAVNLNCDGNGEIDETVMILISGEGEKPNTVEDVLWDDDDIEPAMIDEDSDDDIGKSIPVRDGRASSSETQQYSLYFSTLDLEAMIYQEFLDVKSEFGARDTQDTMIDLDHSLYLGGKRYNGPHICLATLISSDHRMLDYHVISAFILPMVRADATVSIKITMSSSIAVLKTLLCDLEAKLTSYQLIPAEYINVTLCT
ncbi:uncharacterized protein LOC130933921 [Arachis stenosperma]|uniref:uncharacterized protein LOC130933921 n=1 Tax=Arachis stenosperma TaxID=217475 RepID=UPI0025ACCDE5|nr:uncharacterized protein LOC130933921 [Arachis stenosperma]